MGIREAGYGLLRGQVPDHGRVLPRIHGASHRWQQQSLLRLLESPQAGRLPARQRGEIEKTFSEGHLATRLAVLLGLGGRKIFDSLAPRFNVQAQGVATGTGLGELDDSSIGPLLQNLWQLPPVAALAGRDCPKGVRCRPVFSLCADEIRLLDRIALAADQTDFEPQALLSASTGATPWAMADHAAMTGGASGHWLLLIPLTSMNRDCGTLSVLPGSHRYGPRPYPDHGEIRDRLDLVLDSGDLALIHGSLMVAKLRKRVSHEGAVWLMTMS